MDLSNENVIHIKKNGIQYLQFKKLLEYKDKITHAYSVGLDVDFTETLGEKRKNKALKDYKDLCNAIDLNINNLVKPTQTHTDRIKKVNHEINEVTFNSEEFYKIDGLVTDRTNVILATSNADCILLIFYDPIKNVIANTHSGWKGTLQRISIKTVEKMKKEYDCNPKDIICCICPSIRKCHFEVGYDVKKLFFEEFKDLNEIDEIIEETIPNEKWHIDTVLINKIILKQQGLKEENIKDSNICSVCHKDIIHSYRVEKEGFGRATAIICKKERK